MLVILYLLQTPSNLIMLLNVRLMLLYIISGWWYIHLEYLVSFVGYDASYNKWLPVANLANAPDILRSYQNAHGLA